MDDGEGGEGERGTDPYIVDKSSITEEIRGLDGY